MFESIKGVARRTRQSIRQKIGYSEASGEDKELAEVTRKVQLMGRQSETIRAKVERAVTLLEELAATMHEIGEAYQHVPDLEPGARQLAEGVTRVGTNMTEASRQHRQALAQDCVDPLLRFTKECAGLKETRDQCHRNQLEHDFFMEKVLSLRANPPSDFSRLPRNEQALENWRVELWRVNESHKALCSTLYVTGRRTLDQGVLSVVHQLHSFMELASQGFRQVFYDTHLPEYPPEPVLLPNPLPPNPLPPLHAPGLPRGPASAPPPAEPRDVSVAEASRALWAARASRQEGSAATAHTTSPELTDGDRRSEASTPPRPPPTATYQPPPVAHAVDREKDNARPVYQPPPVP